MNQKNTGSDEFDGCAREWIRGSVCDPGRSLTDDDQHRIWQLAELLRRWFGTRVGRLDDQLEKVAYLAANNARLSSLSADARTCAEWIDSLIVIPDMAGRTGDAQAAARRVLEATKESPCP